ncbi:hypothetical protein [Lactococcus lactis]|uniref:hypothetical protein n=1 Tax=Lactococcus lactis TaxID=1358 RepID=UPI0022E8F1DE|nr:hypothetical protein [Lactococcus lactis]
MKERTKKKQSKNMSLVIISIILIIFLVFVGAGTAYLSGIGTHPQIQTSQGRLITQKDDDSIGKGTTRIFSSSSVEKKSKSAISESEKSKVSSSEIKKERNKKTDKVSHQEVSTTNQTPNGKTESPTYVATYEGVSGYSKISYDEALAIAKSIAQDDTKETQDSAHEDTQQVAQQNPEEKVQTIISSIRAQNPDAQINIIN